MNEFKAGDKIIRTGSNCRGGIVRGKTYEVDGIEYGLVHLRGHSGGYSASYFELASHQSPNPVHVHAELIKAWADGAEIQFKNIYDEWKDACTHSWLRREYRIKPTKSDKEIKIEELEAKLLEIHKELGELKGE